MCTKVFRLRTSTLNVIAFPYGNGWRVQYIRTSNSKKDSKLMAHHDEFYTDKHEAVRAFNELSHICEQTHQAHWHRKTFRFN